MSMENNAKQLSSAAAIAQFKLAVIAPAIHGLYPDASKNAYYKRMTQQPLTLPDGSTVCYKPGTLAKWESLYRKGVRDNRKQRIIATRTMLLLPAGMFPVDW